MELTLSPEQAAVRDLAAEFVNREIVPHAADWDRRESVDPGIVKQLGDLGFLGLTIPEELGGSGGDQLSYALVLEELGRGCSSVRGLVSVSLGLVAKAIAANGTPAQQERWLPVLCAGYALGCFALTEAGTGSDAAALTTRAVRDGDDWLITGSKMFITNGTWADVALVFARTGAPDDPDSSQPPHRGITAFLVPTGVAGLTRREIHGKLGLRGQPTAELTFDTVRVPDSDRLGPVGGGFRIAMSTLDKGRMSVAAGCVGIVQACLDAAVEYAGQRTQFGKPIAGHQLVQEMIADSAVDVDASRLLTWAAADLKANGERHSLAASKAKLFATEASIRVANACLQVHGGYGYVEDYPAAKFLRDARVTTLYEGTSQIQKLLIGRALTGISAF